MAVLLNCTTRQRVFLRAEHVFGRSRLADTLLEHSEASLLHASVRWTGRLWELLDHSRNGTLLNHHPVPHERPVPLPVGSLIEFGRNDRSAWLVESLAEPSCVLWPLHEGGAAITLGESNVLPDAAAPELTIRVGNDGQWLCDQAGRMRQLQDGSEVALGGKSWRFLSGAPVHVTQERVPTSTIHPAGLQLDFQVSLNEEHVSLRVTGLPQPVDLGERTHHYCLLTLARLRLEAAQRQIDFAAQGWVELDRLGVMLGLDPQHLNIQIFRARRQFTRALSLTVSPPELVERRRGALRFGSVAARIRRGAALEGEFRPATWGSAGAVP